jgi:hypothetical protein
MGRLAEFIDNFETATPLNEKTEIPPEPDPVVLAERVALKYESDTPNDPGRPVIVEDGHVLACENDLPHVRVFAWALINLRTGQDRPIDMKKAATDCHMTVPETRAAIARLVREGDLEYIKGRYPSRGDLYRLIVQY